MVPDWLYKRTEDRFGPRITRVGSRRPLRIVLTIVKGDDFATAYLVGIGKLGVQFGPEDGVVEGHAGMPRGSRAHAWFLPGGWAVGMSWDA